MCALEHGVNLDRHRRRLRLRPLRGDRRPHWPIPAEDIEEGWAALAAIREVLAHTPAGYDRLLKAAMQ